MFQKTLLVTSLLVFLCVCGDDSKNVAESRIDTYPKHSEKYVFQKQAKLPKKEEEKSFMSRLTSWLFPFGGSDNDDGQDVIPAEGQSRAQYAPPPPPQSHQDKQCSPCNSVPWVPMASNRGPHALLEFKPPNQSPSPSSHNTGFDLQSLKVPQPQPSLDYGPPPNSYVLSQESFGQYSPPKTPLENYGPLPPVHQPAELQFQQSQHHVQPVLPLDEYGPPPPPIPAGQYGPPPSHDQFIAASQHKEQQYHKQKSPYFKPGSTVKATTSAKPYKFIPVKYTQFPKLELGPKPPNAEPPVTFRPLQLQQNNFVNSNLQKYPPIEALENLPSDNFAAPINTHPVTYVVPPPLQFNAPPPQVTHINHIGNNVRGPFIPVPNLSLKPVLPIRNYKNFKTGFIRPANDNLPQQNAYIPWHTYSNQHEVQVQPSIPIAGYLASIEHPINVIQSPIVEVTVNEENLANNSQQVTENSTQKFEEAKYTNEGTRTDFKENPIVVPEGDEDAHFAESSNNQTTHEFFDVNNKRGNDNSLGTFSFNKENSSDQSINILKGNEDLIKQILAIPESTTYSPINSQKPNYTQFTTSPVAYTDWTPSFITTNHSPSDKMTPPFNSPSPWTNYITNSPTTKKPKQIQVIVPYITNQKPMPFNGGLANQQQATSIKSKPDQYESLPVYFTPPSKSPLWPDYSEQESQKVFTAQKPSIIQATNIKELLKGEMVSKQSTTQSLPFDIITLQKTIDDWTQQEFSNKLTAHDQSKITSSSKLAHSKNIPNNFFIIKNYSSTTPQPTSGHYEDHSGASSIQRETKVKKDVTDFESNFITLDSSEENSSTISSEKEIVTSTSKDSVYIVTAKPWSSEKDESTHANITHKTATFAIRLESENDSLTSNKTEKVIYSEWPHLSKYLNI